MSVNPDGLNNPARQRGFSLLEVLIALVVLSVGLLGIAGMQAMAVKNTHSAYMRSQATLLAYSIIDSMRANPDSLSNYAVSFGDSLKTHPSCEATTSTCSTSDLADYDLNIWFCSLGGYSDQTLCNTTLGISGLLPNGQGQVVINGTAVTVSVQWIDERDGTTATMTFESQI